MKWHSAAALWLLVGIYGCAGSRMVLHPPWDRQQGRGVPAQALARSSLRRQVCTPLLNPHLLVVLNQARTFSLTKLQETELATSCRSTSLRSNRLWSQGAQQMGGLQASHSDGPATTREGKGTNISHTHFSTSWAELSCSSPGCVARRGALCPPHGYE